MRNLIAAFILGTAGSGLLSAAPERPNVIFILADDLGWKDTSLYGSKFYETPNIERLARRGMMFTQAYAANPLCSPTRASILSGLWPARIGITAPVCHLPEEFLQETLQEKAGPEARALSARSATRLSTNYFTLAEALKKAGYKTGHFGKWHLGPEPFSPLQQGFDVDVPHWPGPGPAGAYLAPWKSPRFQLPAQPGDHLEDLMSAQATRFIKENKDRPFFLNYWAFSVHAPFDAKKDLVEKYRRKAEPASPQRNGVYGAMVESLDDGVGRLLKAVDENGLADRTIIIFFSDNGGVHWTGHARVGGSPATDEELTQIPITSNHPLRGGKATIYEGGTREPCIVVWPGVTKPGVRSDAVIQSVDFHPTLLEILGLKRQPGQSFDGISFVPALLGKPLAREAIFCHFPHEVKATGNHPSTYVRKGDWKLIRFYCDNDDQSDRHELYNVVDDISETNNLAAARPQMVRELSALIDRFLKESGAVVPRPNPQYRKLPQGAGLPKGWRVAGTASGQVKERQL